MNNSPSPFSKYIGMTVTERYGRFKGKVIGLECSPDGKLKYIIYENGGVVISKSSDSFMINENGIEVAPPLIIKAEEMIKKLESLRLQYETIHLFKTKNSEGYSIFEYIIEDLDKAYEEVKNICSSLTRSLEHRKKSLEERKKWMYKVLFQLEVARKTNAVKDEDYIESYDKLETELFRICREIEDVEMLSTEISLKLKDIEALRSPQQEYEFEEIKEEEEKREAIAEASGSSSENESCEEERIYFPDEWGVSK